MAKAATLDDVTMMLKKQNDYQGKTNKALEELVMLMKEEKTGKKKKETEERGKSKFGGKPSNPADTNEFLGNVIRGDFLGAIFGGVQNIAIVLGGMLFLIIQTAKTLQEEIYDPFNAKLKKINEDVRKFLAAGVLFFSGFGFFLKGTTKVFTALFNLPIFSQIKNFAIVVDTFIKSNLRFAPSNLFGLFTSLGQVFRIVLVLDIGLKSILKGFKAFEQAQGTLTERIFEGVSVALKTAVVETIKSFIGAIPLVFKAIKFLFSDLMLMIERLDIPFISDIAGLVAGAYQIAANIFGWFEELIMSNEKLAKWFNVEAIVEGLSKLATNILGAILWFIEKIILVPLDFILNTIIKFFSSGDFTKLFTTFILPLVKLIFMPFILINKFIIEKIQGIMKALGIKQIDYQKMFKDMGFTMPDRLPWESDEKEKEDQARVAKKPAEQKSMAMEEEKKKKERAERDYKEKSTVVITDASVKTSSTTAVTQNSIMPFMRPIGDNPAVAYVSY